MLFYTLFHNLTISRQIKICKHTLKFFANSYAAPLNLQVFCVGFSSGENQVLKIEIAEISVFLFCLFCPIIGIIWKINFKL